MNNTKCDRREEWSTKITTNTSIGNQKLGEKKDVPLFKAAGFIVPDPSTTRSPPALPLTGLAVETE